MLSSVVLQFSDKSYVFVAHTAHIAHVAQTIPWWVMVTAVVPFVQVRQDISSNPADKNLTGKNRKKIERRNIDHQHARRQQSICKWLRYYTRTFNSSTKPNDVIYVDKHADDLWVMVIHGIGTFKNYDDDDNDLDNDCHDYPLLRITLSTVLPIAEFRIAYVHTGQKRRTGTATLKLTK